MNERLCLSRKEAAEMCDISLPTLDAWMKTKDFPAIKVGRRWLIHREAFERWLEARARSSMYRRADT